MLDTICVIPVRFGSTRFPGKPLALICGKPMIQWVYEAVKRAKYIDKIIIATDDFRIFNVSKKFCPDVILTSKNCNSGTDRVALVAKKIKCRIVVNVQGDEPLIHPSIIDKLIIEIKKDSDIVMTTPVCKFSSENDIKNPNTAKVVIDKNNFALYFSRSVIPYSREIVLNYFYKHIGIYAYRKNFLLKFVKLKQRKLELTEKLEQLRVLENGYKVKTVFVNRNTVPVDVPEDIKKVEMLLNGKN